jgi:hypothetical protein
VTTTGSLSLNGVQKWLDDLDREITDIDAAIGRAELKGADPIQREMAALVPGPRTHNLENHVRIKGPTHEGNDTITEIGVIHDPAFTDPDTARYGNAEEYGWSSGGVWHPGKSYIRAGLDNRRSEAMAAVKQSLKDEGHIS